MSLRIAAQGYTTSIKGVARVFHHTWVEQGTRLILRAAMLLEWHYCGPSPKETSRPHAMKFLNRRTYRLSGMNCH